MIGLARTAQLASLGGFADLTVSAGLSTSTQLPDIHVQRPLKYINWNGVDVTNFSSGLGSFASDSEDEDFDRTDIGNNSRDSVTAFTFRLGPAWLSEVTDSFVPGISAAHFFNWRDDEDIPRNDIRGFSSFYDGNNFLFTAQANAIVFTKAEFNNLRNRWLTLIVATARESANFANWRDSTTDPNDNNWCQRIMLVDIESGIVLKSADGWAFRDGVMPSPGQPWKYGGAGPGFNYSFEAFNGDGDFDGNNWDFAAIWFGFGSVFDPIPHWPEVAGTGAANTVQGVRAWLNVRIDSTDITPRVNGNDEVYAYDIALPNPGHRAPQSLIFRAISDFFNDPATPPSIIDF